MNKKINPLFTWREYILFFFLSTFTVGSNFFLFFEYYNKENKSLYLSGAITFGNILFVSFVCVFFYGIWHKLFIEKPVKRILKATNAVASGDFSTQIKTVHKNSLHFNELDQITENLNLMIKELSGTETLRTDFIANVTHELKTPLASIQNYATLLETTPITSSQREYTDAIIRNSKQLSELITNILKLNKLENQQIFPETKTYDLSEQLTECILGYENLWEQKEINLDTDIEEQISINADDSLLTLVWNNLMSNAIKFTPNKGKINISLHQAGNSAVMTISDNGCGMNQETAAHIFDKFYQGDSSHATQGNGLGLALAKKVIDICNGTIKVESIEAEGSTFIVTLPISRN
jgi:signal transduction histidine kinase